MCAYMQELGRVDLPVGGLEHQVGGVLRVGDVRQNQVQAFTVDRRVVLLQWLQEVGMRLGGVRNEVAVAAPAGVDGCDVAAVPGLGQHSSGGSGGMRSGAAAHSDARVGEDRAHHEPLLQPGVEVQAGFAHCGDKERVRQRQLRSLSNVV